MEKTILKLPGTNDFFTKEAYKTLRTNLQFCGDDVRVVALTSCNENEGKTTITLSLGKSLAELEKRVLVIDADMRKSVMAGRNTTAKNTVGLSELLTGQKPLNDCVYMTQYDFLHIMFAGKYPPNPVELLSKQQFGILVQELREYYDYILIDTPPLGLVIDAAVIAPHCDGAILVMDDQKVHRYQAQGIVMQLKKAGSQLLGVVCNNTKKKSSKSYYYKKHYGYG